MLDLTGYKLTFDDEFTTCSISQTGAGTTWADIRPQWRADASSDVGFGHSSFVDPASGYDPFAVGAGALTITAVPDRTASGVPGSWESGLLTTQNGFSQTYGYFEVRADFSGARGAWDAFWLLPDTQIPDPNGAGRHQELDVVEHYGDGPRSVYSTLHTTDPAPNLHWQNDLQVYTEMAQPAGYHTYGVDWQPDTITFYVDGQATGSKPTPSDMHGPMYLLVDLATQSGGSNDADAAGVPISSRIDYVRAYSRAPDAAAVVPGTSSPADGRDPGRYGATVGSAAAPTAGQASTAAAGTQAPPTAAAPALSNVYRFYDTATHDHVYTASPGEKAAILAGNPTYTYEGAAFATPASGPGTQDVFRFYDTATNTHFLTASAAERDSVLAHLPSLHYEGVAFQAYAAAGSDTVTLERFYDASTHLHHFALPDEAKGMRRGSAGPNWVDEGPGLIVRAATAGAS